MPASYPSTGLHKANNFSTIFDKTLLPYNKQYDNCKNTLCYTYSKNNIYKPHSAVGMVGTIASSTLARKHRI
jgi:hypothetical protein